MQINIMGTRGIPAAHGGFETFAEELALFLVRQGHEVLVYCQKDHGESGVWEEDHWRGIKRRFFAPKSLGPRGTIEFDWACTRDVLKQPGVDLILGYNTAVFSVVQRLRGRCVYMNMDGIEWKRAKWSLWAKVWFFLNEVIGANIANVPIADHPEIARHVRKRCLKNPVMIPYGAKPIEHADETALSEFGLCKDSFLVSIARIEPENSILELVRAFSSISTDKKLVVLGRFDGNNPYHNSVKKAASENVCFPGAIYDPEKVSALRHYCRAYLHGHQVGGTNPSLVEALGAGNVVIAHSNPFNRWVAGSDQFYFSDEIELREILEIVLSENTKLAAAQHAAKKRHAEDFLWEDVLVQYERLLTTQFTKRHVKLAKT